jgi:hypothetical protein
MCDYSLGHFASHPAKVGDGAWSSRDQGATDRHTSAHERHERYDSERRSEMALQIGDTAPDFEAQTTEGRLRFHEWIGDSWAVLFSTVLLIQSLLTSSA